MQVCVYTYLYVRMIKGGLLCGRSIQEQGPHNSSDSRKCVLLVLLHAVCWIRLLIPIVILVEWLAEHVGKQCCPILVEKRAKEIVFLLGASTSDWLMAIAAAVIGQTSISPD